MVLYRRPLRNLFMLPFQNVAQYPVISQLAFHGLVLHVIIINIQPSFVMTLFSFCFSVSLCLSLLHVFHSIHPCPSCSLNYLCCAIHLCHFTLSALAPVCCCILTASLFSALFFIHDCHSTHTCHSMDTFPIPHAPPCSPPHSSCLIHIISCRFMPVASFFMPSFQFTYVTCPIYATHFSNVCHFSHAFYLLHASYPFTHFSIIFLISFYACHLELHR